MTPTALVLAATILLPAAHGPQGDDDVKPAPVTQVLVMPLQARGGGSAYLGQGLSEVLADALKTRTDVQVTVFDMVTADMGASQLGVLARCVEVRCAIELGRLQGMDDVIYGLLDGQVAPPLLRIWRVDVREGLVAGMYSARLSDEQLNALTTNPTAMTNALYGVGVVPPPSLRWQKPGTALPTPDEMRRDPRASIEHLLHSQRELALRTAGGVLLGAAVAGVVTGMIGLAVYAGIVVFNLAWIASTRVNAVPFRLGLFLDGAGMLALVGLVASLPLAGIAAVMLVLPANLLRTPGRRE